MEQILIQNGWTKKGGCTPCGIQNWVNASFPNSVIYTKRVTKGFKIQENGKVVIQWTNEIELENKLNEYQSKKVA